MFKFISNIFIKNRDKADSGFTPQIIDIQFGKATDKEVGELLKKATSLKKTNIDEAILAIEKALKIDPSYPCQDKLIKYLILADRVDEAENIINSLLQKCNDIKDVFNFSNRAVNYELYSDLKFKQQKYDDYLFYFCLSIYNRIVMDTLNEQIKAVKVQLNSFKNEEELTDRKTNKAFKEMGLSVHQSKFIHTFYEVLKSYNYDELYKLVTFLNNKQPNKEQLEIYAIENKKTDWLLWSSNEFHEQIQLFNEDTFIDKYSSYLKPILKNK
jgi:tetratricopeptide (TPR) repeat protein